MEITKNLILFFLVVLAVGGAFLQVFLSRRKAKWPGLVLPSVNFLWSLLYLFNLVPGDSPLGNILKAVTVMLLSNIPTYILLAIYFACREKRKSGIDKMNIQDL